MGKEREKKIKMEIGKRKNFMSLVFSYPLLINLAHSQVDGEIRTISLRHGAELLYVFL
jgi:hypothetical protein